VTPVPRCSHTKITEALALGAVLSLGAVEATAAPTSTTVHLAPPPPPPARPANTWSNYYLDYFNSKATCTARGTAMTTPGRAGYVPGALAYYCYLRNGKFKWSMDIYWD
jgi:hypothetical protein